MASSLILASASNIRATLLRQASIKIDIKPAYIDEDMIRRSFDTEQVPPRDQADILAEYKARKISQKNPGRLVLGCDQIAEINGHILTKPHDQAQAIDQLCQMANKTHRLFSAAVLYQDNQPLWRHIGVVRLTMRSLSTGYISDYVMRNWESIRHSVGSYKLEEEGVRLFARVEGDYFHVLGLPLTELISFLILRGDLEI